jgi:hypothetical protein
VKGNGVTQPFKTFDPQSFENAIHALEVVVNGHRGDVGPTGDGANGKSVGPLVVEDR